MSAYGGTLNEAQFAVLRWVADGSPDGVMEGYVHRTSASALRSRGLLRVSGHGPTWKAEITDRGRAYLDNPPEPPEPHRRGSAPHAAVSRPVKPRVVPPTEQLIADLVAAGGSLQVAAWPTKGERDYKALVATAQRFGKVPVGKRLTTDRDRDVLTIRLEDAIEGTVVEAQPVPVPGRLAKAHRVARRFRDHTDHHEVSKASLSRCTRIVHAIAVEVERRGMRIENVEAKKEQYGRERWSGANDGHLTVTVREHRYSLRVWEEKVTARGRFERENTYTQWIGNHSYTRRKPGRYDANATGRITINLLGYSRESRPSSYSDRQNWTVEDKLPDLIRELEVRAAEDDHRQADAERAAQERQRQWEIEFERAKARYMETHYAKVLQAQISRWHETQAARPYLAALEQTYGGDPEAEEWLGWVSAYIERLDPLNKPPRMPTEPEIKLEDLKAFMPPGMSPYGPRGW